jgi:predicted DNA-binding transcriptional regulator YafY
MGRSDRLYALVEELRARAPRLVPRNELAQRLEVSARTIERDILTLQQAGVPIWTQRGRFGGYAIEQSTTLPPLNLEATEAVAVMAALSVLPNHPFAAAGRRAQQKLLAAMRRADVDQARELATRIRTVTPDGPGPDGEVVRNIERAVVGRRVVDLVYGDRRGTSTTRTVEAHGLHLTARAGYLIGWCRLRDAGRAFRIDRIEKAVVQDEVAPERDLDPMLDWVEGALTLDPTGAPAAAPPFDTDLPRHHGPPAWLTRDVDDAALAAATAPVAALVRRLLSHLPDVEDHDHHGRPAWRLANTEATFAAAQDDGRLWIEATAHDINARTAASPDVYERHYGLTIRLDRIDPHELRRLLLGAYRLSAIRAELGLTWSDVVDLATTSLDDVIDVVDDESRTALVRASSRSPFAELEPDGATLHLRASDDEADALMLADPLTFRRVAAGVVVDLDTIGRRRLAPLLERSWSHAC